jgi:hypothetical protein
LIGDETFLDAVDKLNSFPIPKPEIHQSANKQDVTYIRKLFKKMGLGDIKQPLDPAGRVAGEAPEMLGIDFSHPQALGGDCSGLLLPGQELDCAELKVGYDETIATVEKDSPRQIVLGQHQDHAAVNSKSAHQNKRMSPVFTVSIGADRTIVYLREAQFVNHRNNNTSTWVKIDASVEKHQMDLSHGRLSMLHPEDDIGKMNESGKVVTRFSHGVPEGCKQGVYAAVMFRCSDNVHLFHKETNRLADCTTHERNLWENNPVKLKTNSACHKDITKTRSEWVAEYIKQYGAEDREKALLMHQRIREHILSNSDWASIGK